jgi:hypothetical protein
VSRCINISLVSVSLCHVVSRIWFRKLLVGLTYSSFDWKDMSWIVQDNISSGTLSLQYLCPCYLGLGAMLIVLCGDIVHFTFVETSVTIAIMIIGITVILRLWRT